MKTSNKLLVGFFSLFFLCLFLFLAAAFRHYKEEFLIGNGNSIPKNMALPSIRKIEASGHLRLFLVQGQTPALRIQADENIHPAIALSEKEGVLKVTLQRKVAPNTQVDVFITVDSLQYIALAAAAHLETPNGLRGARLKIEGTSGASGIVQLAYDDLICESSSGARLLLGGTAGNCLFHFSSGGSIDALQLQAQRAKVEGSSGGSAEIQVADELTADLSSGAFLEYLGNPKLGEIHTASGGTIGKKGNF